MLSGVSERLLEGPCLFLEVSSMAGQAWPPGTPAKVDVGSCRASLENLRTNHTWLFAVEQCSENSPSHSGHFCSNQSFSHAREKHKIMFF